MNNLDFAKIAAGSEGICGENKNLGSATRDSGLPLQCDPLRRLTPRLQEVAFLIRYGASSKDIAAKLGLAYSTVKAYKQAIFDELGTNNSLEAALMIRKWIG